MIKVYTYLAIAFITWLFTVNKVKGVSKPMGVICSLLWPIGYIFTIIVGIRIALRDLKNKHDDIQK